MAPDKPGLGQDADVARHARLTLVEDVGELSDRQLQVTHKQQNAGPGRVCEGCENVLRLLH
jgi:hypothetical protein